MSKIIKSILIILAIVVVMAAVMCACGETVEYTIYFDVDGTTYYTLTTSGSETIRIPADPTKEGYTFAGWQCKNGKDFTVNSLLDASISSNMAVYAKWITEAEFTITFESNGGSSVVALAAHGCGAITAPAEPTRSGYTFAGWFID